VIAGQATADGIKGPPGRLRPYGPGGTLAAVQGEESQSNVPGFDTAAHAVQRPTLLRRLDQSLSRPLIVLVAPAGAGKSFLLHQWDAARPDLQFVWLPLGPTDNGPVRFSQRLLQGLADVNPDVSDLAPLVSLHGGGLGTPLLEALEPHLEDFPELVIVLDDLHHLSNAALLTDLGRLVDLLPPQVHLVLSTRIDPPLVLTHHRLRRALTEFRQSDLALDETESSQLLERISGRAVPADSVAVLVSRTEGWAAGLQLAGVTLRLHPDTDAFVTQFSGDDRLVADYLSQEVLDAQSARRRRFLLRISVVDELCADLVGLLTGEPNAQLILEELERESMFLVALDTRREWFRFHHLFRDLLRYRLQAEDPPAEGQLLHQAADWHFARGQVDVGVEYLLRAKAWTAALDVIVSSGSDVFERGEMPMVISWIRGIPEGVRSGRHHVNLLLGALLVPEGHAAEAEDVLRHVATDARASAAEQACAQSFLSGLAQWRPRPEVSINVATRALEMLADLGDVPIPDLLGLSDRSSLETMVVTSGGRAHFLAGHIGVARDWLERALVTDGAAYSVWRVHVLGSLALLEAWSGRTAPAEALVNEALALAKDVGLLSHPSTSDAYLALTLVALERGEPHRAALSLREGTLRAEANRRSQLSWIAHLELALLQAADAKTDQAIATILSSTDEAWVPPPPIVADRLLALQARLLRFKGSPEQALRIVGDGGAVPVPLAAEHAAAALELGRIDQARKSLESLQSLDTTAAPLLEVERLLLQAQLAAAEGFPGDASVLLAEAMSVGQRHSLVDVFVWAGPSVMDMVSRHGEHAAFRDAVLARARQVRTPALTAPLVDPLTDREMEVLTYLPSRLTNAELAERCFVSVNTIKTHMAHIYQKLAVPNRTEAIARAQELGLL
jgi:LuxR family maltose regulon positive regulatory protein